ncbi:HPP family protein [Amycolatopsis suaedae]|uniref:CBS domain-containing protein n=1 Tax=Amycolatopsis suaedae TaxID=2510978 RepID=A0A4Q7JG20_9PSEU|nr:CBS domain-containing protein [Amycolatopsis suaedae]RZQ65923.1 CBS domain-containing protein [Amycolatopsis suaedae]
MRVRDIMTSPAIALTPGASVEEAVDVLLSQGFTTLPVVDTEAGLLGVVTEAELGFARLAPRSRRTGGPEDGALIQHTARPVKDIMVTAAPGIDADADLGELVRRLMDRRQRCLPVLQGDRVVGMVSWRDVLGALVDESAVVRGRAHTGNR